MSDLYESLGVDKGASKEAIKKAYRRKAQKCHPDKKKDGNSDEFLQIQKAYAVLSDDSRRANYDATGEDGGVQDIRSVALNAVAQLILGMMDGADIDHINIVEQARQNVYGQRQNDNGQISKMQAAIGKREKALKRLKHKGKSPNVVVQMVTIEIDKLKRQIENVKAKNDVYEEMLSVLKDYSYETNKQNPQSFVRYVSIRR